VPSAKSGTPCSLVAPAAPDDAQAADVADPGAVDEAKAAQQASATGKYGSTPVKPFKPGTGDDGKPKTGWIEIAMVDESGAVVTGEAYSITLPDGTVATGTLDAKGVARVEGFDPGSCQITFPNLDQEAWEPQ
jgi:type VI secretion system secreted protein VgrG